MKKCVLFSLLVFLSAAIFAKDLPNGFGGVELGMTLSGAKKALKANGQFGYFGDRDVSLLPGDARVLIETDAVVDQQYPGFLTRCWFQFYKEKLYSIIINLNPERIDHYSVYTSLVKKYGEPDDFSPMRSVWKNDAVTVSLERPLSLKYIDNETSESLIKQSLVKKGSDERTRDKFLDEL